MRLLLGLILLCLVVQPRAFGGPRSGGSFGGRAGFSSARSYSAPARSAPTYRAPSFSPPARSYSSGSTWSRPVAPIHTVIVEEHHHYSSTPWIIWDHGDYVPPPRGYGSGGGCSCAPTPAPKDAGSERPARLDAGGADR